MLEFRLVAAVVAALVVAMGEIRSRRLWAVESGERTRSGDVLDVVIVPVPVPVVAPMLGHDLDPESDTDADADSMMVVCVTKVTVSLTLL